MKDLFVIYVHNIETGHLRIHNITDSEYECDSLIEDYSELLESLNIRRHYHIYSERLCGSEALFATDNFLFFVCQQVASLFSTADYALKKNGFNSRGCEKFNYWYLRALEQCERGAKVLDVL